MARICAGGVCVASLAGNQPAKRLKIIPNPSPTDKSTPVMVRASTEVAKYKAFTVSASIPTAPHASKCPTPTPKNEPITPRKKASNKYVTNKIPPSTPIDRSVAISPRLRTTVASRACRIRYAPTKMAIRERMVRLSLKAAVIAARSAARFSVGERER